MTDNVPFIASRVFFMEKAGCKDDRKQFLDFRHWWTSTPPNRVCALLLICLVLSEQTSDDNSFNVLQLNANGIGNEVTYLVVLENKVKWW